MRWAAEQTMLVAVEHITPDLAVPIVEVRNRAAGMTGMFGQVRAPGVAAVEVETWVVGAVDAAVAAAVARHCNQLLRLAVAARAVSHKPGRTTPVVAVEEAAVVGGAAAAVVDVVAAVDSTEACTAHIEVLGQKTPVMSVPAEVRAHSEFGMARSNMQVH